QVDLHPVAGAVVVRGDALAGPAGLLEDLHGDERLQQRAEPAYGVRVDRREPLGGDPQQVGGEAAVDQVELGAAADPGGQIGRPRREPDDEVDQLQQPEVLAGLVTAQLGVAAQLGDVEDLPGP